MKKPMLLTNYPDHVQTIRRAVCVFIQPKLNGFRCVIDTESGTLYSRQGNVFNLPHITTDIKSMSGLPKYIDGELYCHGKTLADIQSMIKSGSSEIKFYCFDVMNNDLFADRINIVRSIKETKNVRTVATDFIFFWSIKRYYRKYLSMGLEGAVIRLNAKYENKRSNSIFKLKPIYND